MGSPISYSTHGPTLAYRTFGHGPRSVLTFHGFGRTHNILLASGKPPYLWGPDKPDMKGISVIHDETKKKRYVQIDLDLIGRKRGEIDDYLDLLLIEARRDEPVIAFEEVEKRLKKPRIRTKR